MNVIANPSPEPTVFPGISHATLAGSAQGLKLLSVWQQVIEPGVGTPPHRHDCEEVVLCSAGRGELHFGRGQRLAFSANQTLTIPPNALHQLVNTGEEPLRMVAVFSKSPVEVNALDGQPLPLPWHT